MDFCDPICAAKILGRALSQLGQNRRLRRPGQMSRNRLSAASDSCPLFWGRERVAFDNMGGVNSYRGFGGASVDLPLAARAQESALRFVAVMQGGAAAGASIARLRLHVLSSSVPWEVDRGVRRGEKRPGTARQCRACQTIEMSSELPPPVGREGIGPQRPAGSCKKANLRPFMQNSRI